MNRLWYDLAYRKQIKAEIEVLAPWYQQVRLPGLIFTRSWNRETLGQWVHCERDSRKLNRFILPMLPVPLKGANILEVGTNAGGNLIWAIRRGAEFACGVEPNERYYRQAQFVRALVPEGRRYFICPNNIETISVHAPSGIPYTYAWLLNVVYHIPGGERVNVIRKIASITRYIVLQGNGLRDTGNGDGQNSLVQIIKSAGLMIEAVRDERHVRGLVIIVRGQA